MVRNDREPDVCRNNLELVAITLSGVKMALIADNVIFRAHWSLLIYFL